MAAAPSRRLRPSRTSPIPTLASLNDLATALPLTQNAPPAPFTGTLTTFANVDNGLLALPGPRSQPAPRSSSFWGSVCHGQP